MRRRGNKSSKVPNVKLRPAEKGAYSHPVVESCWAQDTQHPADDSRILTDTCPRPLSAVVICATGVTDKPTLFKQAVELGATCTAAFTDRVTHLIAVDHGGAKYMCALERKIPIVKPSWITENYQIWLRGDDVDADETVDKHRLPVFSGVVVCPSGITDITRRTQISKLVTAHDGQYLKNLERPVRVTHLLCSGDAETDKMRYAEKFNARGEAKIHLVWEEWFWDSLDFGGRFDEATYQVRRPRPERKQMQGPAPLPPSSSAPSQLDEAPTSSAPLPAHAHVPAYHNAGSTAADETEDEPAFAKVLPDVTLQLWGNLLGRRGYQVTDGEIILSPSKAKAGPAPPGPPSSPPSPENEKPAFGAARSVISSFRRANSFAPPQDTSTAAARQLPFRRTATTTSAAVLANTTTNGNNINNIAGPSRLPAPAAVHPNPTTCMTDASKSVPVDTSSREVQIFAGMRIRPMGEARGASVRTAIEQRGGVVVADETDDDNVDFIVVRLVSGSKLFREEEDARTRAKYRTECWLEQCIYEDRVCAPEEQLAFVPLGIPTPVPGAERVVFSFSGFDQSESHGLKRLLRALGITLAPTFNKRATHLLCPSGTGLKFEKAQEWGVPVVNMQWLAEMTATGRIPSPQGFLVGELYQAGSPPLAIIHNESNKGKGKAVDKGKGRAVPREEALPLARPDVAMKDGKGIVDITNDVPSNGEDQGFALGREAAGRKQPQPVAREPTTIIPPAGDAHDGSRSTYGHGHGLGTRTASTFNSVYYVHPSSIPTQSRPPSLPPMPDSEHGGAGSGSGSEDQGRGTPARELFVPNGLLGHVGQQLQQQQQHQRQQRQPSLPPPRSSASIVAEKSNPNFRIPSSKSPSPMKLQLPRTASGGAVAANPAPGVGVGVGTARQGLVRRTTSRASLSPVKLDPEATKALQESITSLLGKRPSAEAADAGAEGGGGGSGGGGGRNAKRARPQRSKVQSRQVSAANVAVGGDGDRAGADADAAAAKSGKGANALAPMGAFESYEEHAPGHVGRSSQVQEESMRVLYEDPGQRQEKQRLMDMLKSQSAAEEDSIVTGSSSSSFARKSTRRSTRIAG